MTKKVLVFLYCCIFYAFFANFVTFADDNIVYTNKSWNMALSSDEQNALSKWQNKVINVASFSNSNKNKAILDSVSNALGLKFNYIEYVNFSSALDAVQNGESKLVSNVSYTSARDKVLAFSGATDIDAVHLFANQPDILDDMSNKKIGVEKGTIWVDVAKNNFPHSEIVEFTDVSNILSLLDSNAIDAVLCSDKFYSIFVLANKFPVNIDDRLSIVTTSIAGTKNEMEPLLDIINKYIRSNDFQNNLNIFNEKYYSDIDKKHLEQQLSSFKGSLDKVYNVGVLNGSPYAIYSKGQWSGIYPDVLAAISKKTGLKYNIVSNPNDTLKALVDETVSGKIDILMPVTNSTIRKNDMYITNNISSENSVIITRSNYKSPYIYTSVSNLIFEKIGVVKGSVDENLLLSIFPKKNFVSYSSFDGLINGILTGEVNYGPVNETEFLQYVNDKKDFKIKIDDSINFSRKNNLAIALNKSPNNEDLAKIFSTSIRLIDLSSIKDRYIHTMNYTEYYKQKNQIFYLIILLLILSFFGTYLIIYRLRKIARTDVLCKILNRNALAFDYKRGLKKNETIIYFDVNNFKEINDVYGHNTGDEVLKRFAALGKNEKIKIYRIGGDEFVAIDNFHTKKITIDEFVNIYSNNKFIINGISHNVSASIGVLPDHIVRNNDLASDLSIVDMAMYEAKKHCLTTAYINKEKFDEYQESLNLRKKLEKSVIEKDVCVNFQPVFNIEKNQIIGFEVLSNWKFDNHGYSTEKSLDQIKFLGLESEIDIISLKWVEKCCAEMEKTNIKFKISINVCAQTIMKIGKNDIILENFNIPKDVLILEISEDIYINEKTFQFVNSIMNSGYRIAIDNFGSGNASINCTKSDRFNYIKIDESIFSGDASNADVKNIILKSQIEIVKQLGKMIVAIGVETIEEFDYLKSIGIINIQGGFLSKPLDFDGFAELISKKDMFFNISYIE